MLLLFAGPSRAELLVTCCLTQNLVSFLGHFEFDLFRSLRLILDVVQLTAACKLISDSARIVPVFTLVSSWEVDVANEPCERTR